METQHRRQVLIAGLPAIGMPNVGQLQQPKLVSNFMTKLADLDDQICAFHHKMVYAGICWRYELALRLASDKKAFAAFVQDKRIGTLPRPPKKSSDALRCLFSATYADPKKASKYFKRVERFWIKTQPADSVGKFLHKHGLSDTPRKPSPSLTDDVDQRIPTKKGRRAAKKTAFDGGRRSQATGAEDPPCGTVSDWPGKVEVGRQYRLTVKVFENEGGVARFQLLDSPELLD